MAGIITQPITGAVGVEAQGTEAIPSSTGEVLGAEAEGGLAHVFPSYEAYRYGQEEAGLMAGYVEGERPGMLSADDANARYGIEGRLKFSDPVPEEVAREISQRRHDSIAREDITARRESGLMTGGAARFAAGLVGGLPGIVDPLNIAAAFIPFVPAARAAIWAARAGQGALAQAGVRAGVGALQGAAGGALLAPLQYGLARGEGEDYGAVDALLNIALGGVFGGGLHTLLGRRAAPEAERLALDIERARPETKEALLRGAVADMAEGRPVETPAEIFDRAGYIDEPATGARPYDTVPPEPLRLTSFLQRAGGLRDDAGELAARDLGRSRPGLVNRAGLPLDEAALRAWQEGYLPGEERPDTNTLLDALDRDRAGTPVYAEQDEFSAAQYRQAVEHNSEIDRLAAEHGIPTRGLTQPQFYAAVTERIGREAAGAEAERLAAGADSIMARAHDEGWVPDFDTGGSPEELEDAYRSETAARGAAAGQGGAGEPGSVGRAARDDEAGAGRGGRGPGDRRRAEPGAEPDAAAERSGPERAPLDELNDEIATLEKELRQGEAEGAARPAELEAADRQVAEAEAEARAIEQSGVCLGRRL